MMCCHCRGGDSPNDDGASLGDAGQVGDPEAEDDKTTAAFEWVCPLPSRASELVVIFLVRERARARSSRDKARTHRPPPFHLARNVL